MDPEPLEPVSPDARAQRARTIIYIVMAALTASPFIVYVILGSRAVPTQ